jgi:hypothetical protein
MKTWTLIAGIFLAAGLGSGCQNRRDALPPPTLGVSPRQTPAPFEMACLAKPEEDDSLPDLVRRLAPLIIQEVVSPDASSRALEPGCKSLPAEVYFAVGVAQFQAGPRIQVTYGWPVTTPDGIGSKRAMQGVRITLDAGGQPVLWQALRETDSAGAIFVSRNLEAAALAEFGGREAGRTFALERGKRTGAAFRIAALVEDGPVLMGPILYVRAKTHDLMTVGCRCSPTQARQLAGQQTYRLVPGDQYIARAEENLKQVGGPPADDLDLWLRLPASF